MNEKNLQNISLHKLHPHPKNPNQLNEENLQKLKEHIRRTGHYPSLIVRPKDDYYELLDGFHRWLVLQDLRYQTASCEVWNVDDREAEMLLATLNRLRGTDDTEKRAKLLANIVLEFGDYDISKLFPESDRALDALLRTLDTPGEINIEAERGLVEAQLLQSGVDQEKAERISQQYHAPGTHGVLKFVFFSETDYNKAVQFFGEKGDTRKLMQLITKYGRKTTT